MPRLNEQNLDDRAWNYISSTRFGKAAEIVAAVIGFLLKILMLAVADPVRAYLLKVGNSTVAAWSSFALILCIPAGAAVYLHYDTVEPLRIEEAAWYAANTEAKHLQNLATRERRAGEGLPKPYHIPRVFDVGVFAIDSGGLTVKAEAFKGATRLRLKYHVTTPSGPQAGDVLYKSFPAVTTPKTLVQARFDKLEFLGAWIPNAGTRFALELAVLDDEGNESRFRGSGTHPTIP